jgi:hypothetical protein
VPDVKEHQRVAVIHQLPVALTNSRLHSISPEQRSRHLGRLAFQNWQQVDSFSARLVKFRVNVDFKYCETARVGAP